MTSDTSNSAVGLLCAAAVAGGLLMAAGTAGAAPLSDGQVFKLWDGTPPGTETSTVTPTVVERSKTLFKSDRAMVGIKEPLLTAVVPEKPNGSAIIVAPGGAYARVVLDKEGGEAASWLKPLGVTVFLMNYRLPAEGHANGKDVPLQDGQRAVRLVRAHASEWGIDPQKIGILGFSAGGHAAATLITNFDRKVYEPRDAADQVSARPDFALLAYPVVSMVDDLTHKESRANLIGKEPTPELISAYSAEQQVKNNTPQTFIVGADDDPGVPPHSWLALYSALHKAGVSAELHIYKEAGHGFGVVRATQLPASHWSELGEAWLRRIGIVN